MSGNGFHNWRTRLIPKNGWKYLFHKGYCDKCKRRSILLGHSFDGFSSVCANPKCNNYSVYQSD